MLISFWVFGHDVPGFIPQRIERPRKTLSRFIRCKWEVRSRFRSQVEDAFHVSNLDQARV